MPLNSHGDCGSCELDAPERAQILPPDPPAGGTVRVRGATWRLRECVPHEDCSELRLDPIDAGESRVLLSPFDRVTRVAASRRLRPVRLRRLAGALALLLAKTRRAGGLAAVPAGARVLPYQLEPALAIAGGESRVILADEVGLGKTAQAGWILADLLARRPDARILIATPAGLRAQWRAELADLFEIRAVCVDAQWVRRTVADLPPDVNPWSVPGVYLTSIDFLKRRDITHAVARHVWDVLVVDEAHGAAAPTDRFDALSRIAAGARTIVTITATPFSGDSAAFASLAGLGSRSGEQALMFRRSRLDAGIAAERRHHFATVRPTPQERHFQRLMERYAREVWRQRDCSADARLAVMILRKRALSSSAAAARSLGRRLALLEARAEGPIQLPLFGEDSDVADEEPIAALAAPGMPDRGLECRRLSALVEAAQRASAAESKPAYLRRLLRRLGDEPVIVFTEYRDTLLQLRADHPSAGILHGGLPLAEREEAQRAFNASGGLLLATDAAAEGLNLQHRCRAVVNVELPWNPARLEQRIGRVDRIGQRRRVHAITLVAQHSSEQLVIANLVRRLQRVSATLGERDRLSSFLDDLKMAQIVIGGAPGPRGDPEAASPAARIAPLNPDREIEALRLALHGRLRHLRAPTPTAGEVLVSCQPAGRELPAGAVLLYSWAVRSQDGAIWSHAIVPVHLRAAIDKPRTAAHARARAAEILDRDGSRAESAVRALATSWLAETIASARSAIERQRDRELELASRRVQPGEVQAGLFDRRAVTVADGIEATDAERQLEHQLRIASLARSATIDEHLDLVAVLLVFRR